MNTRKMWLLFFSAKGMVLLAPLSFFVVHYMVNSSALSKKQEVDLFDDNGYTPLMYAAQRVYTDGVQKLLEQGASLNLQSRALAPRYTNPDGTQKIDGSTATHMACSNLDNNEAKKIIRMLVSKGADLRIKSIASGQPPLLTAGYSTYTLDSRMMDLTELLVKNGADINATDSDGDTLLHYAVENRRADWLQALLGKRFGAIVDRSIKNKRRLTALERAQELRLELMTDVFNEHKEPPVYTPDERDPNGMTGLMLAAIRGDRAYINKIPDNAPILDARTVENIGDEYGYTALHLALLQEKLPIVRLLLDKGARPEMRDKRGLPFFHRVFSLESLDDRKKVIDMVSKQSTLNIQDINGNTILHHAVINNDPGLIRYLLSKYHDDVALTIPNNNSDRPLDVARKIGSPEVLQALGQ